MLNVKFHICPVCGKEFIAYSTYYFGPENKWVDGNTQVQVGDEISPDDITYIKR